MAVSYENEIQQWQSYHQKCTFAGTIVLGVYSAILYSHIVPLNVEQRTTFINACNLANSCIQQAGTFLKQGIISMQGGEAANIQLPPAQPTAWAPLSSENTIIGAIWEAIRPILEVMLINLSTSDVLLKEILMILLTEADKFIQVIEEIFKSVNLD